MGISKRVGDLAVGWAGRKFDRLEIKITDIELGNITARQLYRSKYRNNLESKLIQVREFVISASFKRKQIQISSSVDILNIIQLLEMLLEDIQIVWRTRNFFVLGKKCIGG